MLTSLVEKIRSVSLIWKLLIPFLTFSFVGTTTLVYIGLTSQQDLVKKEEKKEISKLFQVFQTAMNQRERNALALATTVAENREVRRLLAERNKQGLTDLLLPLFEHLKREFGILQFHFHVPPGKSFLRLHLPELSGEMISYRKTIIEAMRTRKGVAGLEWGLAGLGIRGVAPVFDEGAVVGTVEIGYPFGAEFLNMLRANWGAHFTVYERLGTASYRVLATTLEMGSELFPTADLPEHLDGQPVILIAPPKSPKTSILLGPIKDSFGEVVALVEIEVDRSAINERLEKIRELMFFIGLAGLFVSFLLTYVVAWFFVRPIKEIVREAQDIAQGTRESRLDPRPRDEIGDLTHSLNVMLESLKERQMQIEDYARTLEIRVQDRTAELVASEEKYRTLVENLPLIVYRVLKDGTTEFVNPNFTEKLGYSIEEVVADRNFWLDKICGGHPDNEKALRDCFNEGEELRVERKVRDKQGHVHVFIDHALPFKDPQGKVKWIDGFMVEITELKRLQERTLRAEEIKVVGEISARFAHEIRNPLATAGGFARRLRDAFSQQDPHYKIAQIIVEEVARLEDLLKIILSSLEPITLCISELDFQHLLRSWLKDLRQEIKKKGIRVVESLSPSVSRIQGDEGLLNRAFETVLRHAVASAPDGGELLVSTSAEDDHLVVTIKHSAKGLSDEDLEQFFFPRSTIKVGPSVHELPLSKIIIHRHGGRVDVFRDEGDRIVLRIELPVHFQGPMGDVMPDQIA